MPEAQVKVFKRAAIGGFDRQDVADYVRQLLYERGYYYNQLVQKAAEADELRRQLSTAAQSDPVVKYVREIDTAELDKAKAEILRLRAMIEENNKKYIASLSDADKKMSEAELRVQAAIALAREADNRAKNAASEAERMAQTQILDIISAANKAEVAANERLALSEARVKNAELFATMRIEQAQAELDGKLKEIKSEADKRVEEVNQYADQIRKVVESVHSKELAIEEIMKCAAELETVSKNFCDAVVKLRDVQ